MDRRDPVHGIGYVALPREKLCWFEIDNRRTVEGVQPLHLNHVLVAAKHDDGGQSDEIGPDRCSGGEKAGESVVGVSFGVNLRGHLIAFAPGKPPENRELLKVFDSIKCFGPSRVYHQVRDNTGPVWAFWPFYIVSNHPNWSNGS